jgi:hypothetical protein
VPCVVLQQVFWLPTWFFTEYDLMLITTCIA